MLTALEDAPLQAITRATNADFRLTIPHPQTGHSFSSGRPMSREAYCIWDGWKQCILQEAIFVGKKYVMLFTAWAFAHWKKKSYGEGSVLCQQFPTVSHFRGLSLSRFTLLSHDNLNPLLQPIYISALNFTFHAVPDLINVMLPLIFPLLSPILCCGLTALNRLSMYAHEKSRGVSEQSHASKNNLSLQIEIMSL